MSFRKKALYYGLMLFLSLLALEGMARLAYYAAYGQGYSGGRLEMAADTAPPARATRSWLIRHPFYGYTRNLTDHNLNATPPRQRREDTVVIGLVGGSVARDVRPFLERALHRYFAANARPRRPVVRGLATEGAKQPQQTLIVADALLRGGEFDLIINLDGRNEIAETAGQNFANGLFPFFPFLWNKRVGLTARELLLAGRIGVLRGEQGRLAAAGSSSLLSRSAVFGLVNRYRQERAAAEIIRRNRELAATAAAYNLERYGPRDWREEELALLPAAARVWYRGSVALARLAELDGADYYHFLQPNQYVPGAKPLSPEELQSAYKPVGYFGDIIAQGYPLLRAFSRDLQRQGVNYFDLTGIFAAHPETLYRDPCCHLNDRGNELLAAAMVRRMEPALLRLGLESPAAPVSALAAARRPAEPDLLLVAADFQVYLRDNAKLRYVRDNCNPADTAARFFLHLTPQNRADLPRHRRGQGFDNLDFSFAEAGGHRWRGQCLVEIPLPGYPIADLRTGQYVPYAGALWAGDFAFPE